MPEDILQYIPHNIADIVENLAEWKNKLIIEIRLRVNQPLQVVTRNNNFFVGENGKKTISKSLAYLVTKKDVDQAFMILTKNSVYAVEHQLAEGFITIPGGHRVGFTGQAILKNKELKAIKNINSINYRISREIIGIADKVINKIFDNKNDYIYNTLIISPPLCGKTSLLRDLIRLISDGSGKFGLSGKKISVVDERSEIGGAYNGVARNNIGSRTDLLDNCPKAEGIMLLIRSMSPEVIAVDEIGREEDVKAIREAINSGVSLLTTVHGRNLQTVNTRPSISKLIIDKAFERYILLSRRKGIGTIEKVLDSKGKEVN